MICLYIVFKLCSEFIDVAVQFKDGQDVPLNHSVANVYYVFTGAIFMKGLNFSIILSCPL